MKKFLYLGAALLIGASSLTSCKKSTVFEKGDVSFKINGKTFSSTYSATATYQLGVLIVGSQGKVGSDIYPSQVQLTIENAAEGDIIQDDLVISGSWGTDLFATHWDSDLVGSGTCNLEVFSESECKGTFSATVKSDDLSKTYQLTEGKFWLNL